MVSLFGPQWNSRRGPPRRSNQSAATASPPDSWPDYAAFVDEMDASRRAEFAAFLREHAVAAPFAAADESWPLLFPFLDESTRGRAKFVIWRRNCSLWASSYVRWFRGRGAGGFSRFSLLSYGDGCMACLDREPLERACESHYAAVERYFGARAERRARLLEVDFTRADAGRALCAFALGVGEESAACAAFGGVPNVPPEKLTSTWSEAFGHERVVGELTRRLEAVPAGWR